ncbi:hypothetical protein [Paenibacillus thalictri]|uniref:Uncharacterized protein n=1 Tax=Paenibacillus thalictri TaxID=2527873 RepID=A0A4Q9DLU7_9BACL|nr:hypothetical protein [Paenibacillus thalictri]TBL76255.1 hypothetical protein EYB31_19825 [Paenibacillus thalictri]
MRTPEQIEKIKEMWDRIRSEGKDIPGAMATPEQIAQHDEQQRLRNQNQRVLKTKQSGALVSSEVSSEEFSQSPGPIGGGGGGTTTAGIFHPAPSSDQYIPTYIPQIVDQVVVNPVTWEVPGEAGSCVACAIATALNVLKHREYGAKYTNFSISWIFGNRAVTDFQGDGMFTSQALSRVQSIGALKYGDSINPDFGDAEWYPDNRYYLSSSGSTWSARSIVDNEYSSVVSKANLYKIGSWWSITDNDSLKNAITNNGAALIDMFCGVDSTNSNWLWAAGNNNGMCNQTNYTTSTAHTMCVIGWKNINNEGFWICANGWGYTGDNGIYYVAMSHPAIYGAYGLSNTSTPSHVPDGRPNNISFSRVGSSSTYNINFYAQYTTDFTMFDVYANNNMGSGDVYKATIYPTKSESDRYLYDAISGTIELDSEGVNYTIKLISRNGIGYSSKHREINFRSGDSTAPTWYNMYAESITSHAAKIIGQAYGDGESGLKQANFYLNGNFVTSVPFNINAGEERTYIIYSIACNLSNLVEDTDYIVTAKVEDKAGNMSGNTTFPFRTKNVTRPDFFSWTYPKNYNQTFNLTASEWNSLQDNINDVRVNYKALPSFPFTRASQGATFTADMLLQTIIAISGGPYGVQGTSPTYYLGVTPSIAPPASKNKGDVITADTLNGLVSSINSVL